MGNLIARAGKKAGRRSTLPQVNYPVVYFSDDKADQESHHKSVGQTDQAAEEGYLIADEKLREEPEMGANDGFSFRANSMAGPMPSFSERLP